MDDQEKLCFAHIMTSSYLSAVYSYMTWKHPMDYDEKTFENAEKEVKKHHGDLFERIVITLSKK